MEGKEPFSFAELHFMKTHSNHKIHIHLMRTIKTTLVLLLALFVHAASVQAQSRRPIDPQHPLWLIHIDVWNNANPQSIIDLIPDDVKPFVCFNLSLSCQYDKDLKIYKMQTSSVGTMPSSSGDSMNRTMQAPAHKHHALHSLPNLCLCTTSMVVSSPSVSAEISGRTHSTLSA